MGIILDLQGEKVVEICFTTVLVYLKMNVINFMLYFTIFFLKPDLLWIPQINLAILCVNYQYFLSTYCLSGSVLATWNTAMNSKNLSCHKAYKLERNNKQTLNKIC